MDRMDMIHAVRQRFQVALNGRFQQTLVAPDEATKFFWDFREVTNDILAELIDNGEFYSKDLFLRAIRAADRSAAALEAVLRVLTECDQVRVQELARRRRSLRRSERILRHRGLVKYADTLRYEHVLIKRALRAHRRYAHLRESCPVRCGP